MSEQPLAKLEKELADALSAYRTADREYDAARRVRTDSQNRLNQAQKQFDAYVEKLKGEAPGETDWGSIRQHRLAVRAA